MTMTTRFRLTLAQGIYLDEHGVTVIARVGSGAAMRAARARFPSVDGDGIPYSKKNNSELIKCRLQLLEDLRRQRAHVETSGDTLRAAIAAFLSDHPAVKGTPTEQKYKDYVYLLGAWQKTELADLPVAEVTRKKIRTQLVAWAQTFAPSTCNSRKHALADVLRVELEDEDAEDDVILPTDKVPQIKPRGRQARGIEYPILLRILATLPDRGRADKGEDMPAVSLTKIRLTVMVWTGLAHKSLMRLERRQVNFRDEKLFLPARKKGKGAPGVWVDLLPQAVDALRAYDAAGLWKTTFSRASMWKSWQRAVKRTRAGLAAEAAKTGDQTMLEQFDVAVPENCHPYDCRHSFLTDVLRKTGDLRAAQELAQHQDMKTTEHYIKAAVPERVAAAIEKMRAAWFPDQPAKVAGVVRDFQLVKKDS
jgi:integrase